MALAFAASPDPASFAPRAALSPRLLTRAHFSAASMEAMEGVMGEFGIAMDDERIASLEEDSLMLDFILRQSRIPIQTHNGWIVQEWVGRITGRGESPRAALREAMATLKWTRPPGNSKT